jgi:hypothetical protein
MGSLALYPLRRGFRRDFETMKYALLLFASKIWDSFLIASTYGVAYKVIPLDVYLTSLICLFLMGMLWRYLRSGWVPRIDYK